LAEIDALESAQPLLATAGAASSPGGTGLGAVDSRSGPAGVSVGILTPREREVLQAIAEGLSTKDAARTLFISVKTVKNHLASIYEKLDARDRTQAVLGAARLGIIKLP
jgi:DNA-binding NarL/FixJ family response regulator